jgi:hypothetical protein
VRRSIEPRRVRFGQYIAELQHFRPDLVITEHSHQYIPVNWYPRFVEHHRGDEGAAKPELVAQGGDAETRSSGTEINFLCLRVVGLSLCGFHLGQSHANHNGQMKCFFSSLYSHAAFYGSFKLRVVWSRRPAATRAHGCGNHNDSFFISPYDPRATRD